jgi:cytochrome P450
MTVQPAMIDLSDDESFRNGFPHDYFTFLRNTRPVFWHEPTDRTPDGEGFWVVSRYGESSAILRDPVTFSSERGGIRAGGGTALKDEGGAGRVLNMTDDPQHRRLRALVNRGFTPRAISALEEELRRRARALIAAAGDDAFDFVQAFARELPGQAICLVLGVPESDRQALLDWLDRGIEDYSQSILSADSLRHLSDYAVELIERKRARPDDAIMSTIVHARYDEGDGSALTDQELISFFMLLLPAGAETTRSALAGGVKAFIDDPAEFVRLRADVALIPTAVEEIVRWTTPSIYKRRTASRDVELGGVAISAGEKVTFWEMSANRDESVFEKPFNFDVGRAPNPHLGFGWGTHFCLGASLARLEIKVTLEVLVERFAGFEQRGADAWMPNNRLLGLKSLPIRLVQA